MGCAIKPSATYGTFWCVSVIICVSVINNDICVAVVLYKINQLLLETSHTLVVTIGHQYLRLRLSPSVKLEA